MFFSTTMPQKLSEAFRLPITGGGNIRSGDYGVLSDNQANWRYQGAGPVGSNASAGAMNYQSMGPLNNAPHLSAGAAQYRPVTGYTQPGVSFNPPGAIQNYQVTPQEPVQNSLQRLVGSFNTASPEFSNTLLFIAVAVFFLYLLDMIVKSARGG